MATLPTDAKRNWESEKSVTNCLWVIILPPVLRVISFAYKPILVLNRWLTGAANERSCNQEILYEPHIGTMIVETFQRRANVAWFCLLEVRLFNN